MGLLASVGSQFPAIMAALILATDRKIVRRLREAGAVAPGLAVELDPPGPFGPARLRRMVTAGAVGTSGANRYYLDEQGYRAWRSVRRKRALVVLAIMICVIAARADGRAS